MGILANENAISSGGYQISNSLRFQSASTQYLAKTFGTTGTGAAKTWTWSGWVKRGTLGTSQTIISGYGANNDSGYTTVYFFNDNIRVTGYTSTWLQTTQVFRDPSAWYHIVVVYDSTQATSTNRIKLYINGSQVTAFGTANYPSLNQTSGIDNANAHDIGNDPANSSGIFDGYMAEVNFIDGQALTPSSFGSTDATSGQWVAKKYTGTYGTNGFYLPFSNGTSTTTLGADSSGNSNNWTLTNFTRSAGVSDCWMTDVPSGNSVTGGNYCVLNAVNSSATLSQANLKSVEGASGSRISIGTIGMTTGKWYWEVTAGSTGLELGVGTSQLAVSAGNLHATGCGWGYNSDGNIYPGAVSGNATYTTNDVIGLAFNADTGVLSFYKNNTLQPTTVTGLTSAPYFPASGNGTGATNLYNFGQRSFAYTPPSGFKALCTANL